MLLKWRLKIIHKMQSACGKPDNIQMSWQTDAYAAQMENLKRAYSKKDFLYL